MYTSPSLVATLLLYPLAVLSQVTTTAGAVPAQQTIVPFSTLPACAAKCGPLYDAQGACSPPVVPASSDSCFCAYSTLQAFYKTTAGVCDSACPDDPNGLTKIQQWFLGLCSRAAAPSTATVSDNPGASIPTGTSAPGSATTGSAGSPTGTDQSWISTHWQWILMVVILSLAIIIGWIAACLLRRRYIRRKEREYELRPPAAPWVAGQPTHTGTADALPYGGGFAKGKDKEAAAGMFVARPPSAARMNEKSGRKKWVVKERT